MRRRPTAARVELSGLLDVLMIVLLATLLRPVFASSEAAVPANEPAPEVAASGDGDAPPGDSAVEEAPPVSDAPTEPPPEPAVDPAELQALLESVTEALDTLDERLAEGEGDPRADAVMEAFLRNEVVLVQAVVSRDEITRVRRFGEPWRVLETSVAVEREPDADGSGDRASGDVLPRVVEQLPESWGMTGRAGSFVLFVPDADAEPLYWAAQALRAEIAGQNAVEAYYPPPTVMLP